MYRVTPNLKQHTVAAGEPMVLEVQFLATDGSGKDLDDASLAMTIYKSGTRAQLYQGIASREETSGGMEFFRWVIEGNTTNELAGNSGMMVEIAKRLRHGREIVSTGSFSIAESADNVPSLDNAAVALTAQRVTLKDANVLGDDPTVTVTTVAYQAANPATPNPYLSLSSAQTQTEGNSGTVTFTYTLTLTRDGSTASYPFTWAVSGTGANPANAADFGGTFPSGSGTFDPGQTVKTITILAAGDTTVEQDETFLLTVNATGLATVTATGTITNDDASQAPAFARGAFIGDSIWENAASLPAGFIAANPDLQLQNFSQGGAGIGSPSDAAGTNSGFGRLNAVGAYAPDTAIINLGANDILSYGGTDGASYAASFIARAKQFTTALRAKGVARVIWCLVGPKGNNPGLHNAAAPLANASLRAGVGDWIEAIIPWAEHPDMTAANFANMSFGDGDVHPNAAGYAIVNQVGNDVLLPLKAGSIATTPTQFTFLDLNNQAPGSTVTARVRVTDMGMGQRATQAMTGAGDMATGQGAFGTAARNVMNGDVAIRRLVNSNSDDTAVDGPLTIGTTTDTFTTRTAAAASAAVAFASQAGSYAKAPAQNGESNAIPFTFAAVPFPAGRPVILVFKDNSAPVSVTCNGVAAALVVSTDQFYLYAGPTSQNLSAGTYDVVVTAAPFAAYSCSIWAGAAANSTKAITQTAKLGFGFRDDANHAADAALTVGTGGQGVIFYMTSIDTATLPTFVNADQNRRYPALVVNDGTGTVVGYWATFTDSQTPTVKQPGYGFDMMLAAVLP